MPDNETKKASVPGTGGVLESDPSEALIAQFIQGSDILIMDSQYTASEYQTHINWGHGCVDEVVRLAALANVKHLYLFHHDPAHDDECVSAMLDHAVELVRSIGSPMRVSAAREEEEIQLHMPQPAGHSVDRS
jgi:ribonuclease BN (tRNA processing enzyme)